MIFRPKYYGNSQPFSYPVDPSCKFNSGMIGQLTMYGNSIVCGVSDGTAPLGVLDDVKTDELLGPAIDETHIIRPTPQVVGSKVVSATDHLHLLNNSRIAADSFVSDIQVYLTPKNGAVTVPSNTEFNFDEDGDGIPDAIKLTCSYAYQLIGIPGDDTTIGSGRVTIWFGRMIFETDQFETSQRYPLNHMLFVSEAGQLTTRMATPTHPPVALVTGPPTSSILTLEAMWI